MYTFMLCPIHRVDLAAGPSDSKSLRLSPEMHWRAVDPKRLLAVADSDDPGAGMFSTI